MIVLLLILAGATGTWFVAALIADHRPLRRTTRKGTHRR